MHLFLVRHGEYIPESINPQKPLSEKGQEDTKRVAYILKNRGFSVDVFIHSGKTRALQTAEILKSVINPDGMIKVSESISPFDSVDNILSDISGFVKNTMIVGHAPFLPKLASGLLGHTEAIKTMSTSSVIILNKDRAKEWHLIDFINQ